MKALASILAAVALLAAVSDARAQRPAGSKIEGTAYEYPYFYNSAATYQDYAYQHADLLRDATSYGEPVPQEIAQEHTAGIRQGVAAAQKKYAAMGKMATGNKAVQKHLDVIAEHHKKALAAADQIDAHTKTGPGDAAKVNAAAHSAAESLKAAQAEHEKLMQYFTRPSGK